MTEYILKESVLNDDTLYIADENKVFKGNYIAFIKVYTFANEWSNKEIIKRFRNEIQLNKYLENHYPDFYFYN